MPNSCHDTRRMAKTRLAMVRTTPAQEKTTALSHLPSSSDIRETGLISRGSSDWRSRSPAVVSTARFMPVIKAAKIRYIGIKIIKWAARWRSLAMSTVSTDMGCPSCGLMPRAMSRSRPIMRP